MIKINVFAFVINVLGKQWKIKNRKISSYVRNVWSIFVQNVANPFRLVIIDLL